MELLHSKLTNSQKAVATKTRSPVTVQTRLKQQLHKLYRFSNTKDGFSAQKFSKCILIEFTSGQTNESVK